MYGGPLEWLKTLCWNITKEAELWAVIEKKVISLFYLVELGGGRLNLLTIYRYFYKRVQILGDLKNLSKYLAISLEENDVKRF